MVFYYNDCFHDLCMASFKSCWYLKKIELHLCFHFSRYNNKTYRIDDINWEVFPSHTFHGRFKGVERDISYRDYYLEVLIVFFFINCSSWWQIPSWERYRYFQKLHKHSQPWFMQTIAQIKNLMPSFLHFLSFYPHWTWLRTIVYWVMGKVYYNSSFVVSFFQ